MAYIPSFVTPEHEQEYYALFDTQLETFADLLHKTRQRLFPGTTFMGLDSRTIEVLNDITRSLIYDVNDRFEDKHPNYKSESDLFFSTSKVREVIKEYIAQQTPST
jgi:hypothetical protein